MRRAVAEFIYHYHGERNHQGLGNAFVFLDTTVSAVLALEVSAKRTSNAARGAEKNGSTRIRVGKS